MRSHRTFCSAVVLLALILPASLSLASTDASPFKNVAWSPSQLDAGSVCLFTVDFAGATSLSGKWMGHDLFFARSKGKSVWFAAAGVDVEAAAGTYPLHLEATLPDGKTVSSEQQVAVLPAGYKTEKLHVAARFVEPDAASLKIIEADREVKKKIFERETAAPEWSGDFAAPVNSEVSETFGTRRTFNGKLASIHRGVDYRAKMGTPVLASNSGEVILARPLYYEGNCVVVDHGQGLMTIYMHLSKFQVAEGDKVRKGEEIGLSGATGRVTGPHLHMAARWEGAYVDPLKLMKLSLPVLE